ncbi:MAG: glycosyltransferase family 4 protein, partial [Ardenticatenales bacterium]
RAELERLAATLGVASAVEFVGRVAPQDVPALINTASLVVVPSRWDEPFGLVALEAALMERPVVATRVGGLVEAVEHGITGLVVDKEDPEALADAIVALLEDCPTADRMGRAGRTRARDRFGWSRCVDEYDRLYQQTQLMEMSHD